MLDISQDYDTFIYFQQNKPKHGSRLLLQYRDSNNNDKLGQAKRVPVLEHLREISLSLEIKRV
jgi:hypothetical protein